MVSVTGPSQSAVSWSAAHGFGSVPLAAVIGKEQFHLVSESPSVLAGNGQVILAVSGANDLGNNNAAVAFTPQWYSGDFSSYVSAPAFDGNGRIEDAVFGLGSGSSFGSWAPGFQGNDAPYTALLVTSSPTLPGAPVDVWTGAAGDGTLGDPSNWSLGSVPGSDNTALFTGGGVISAGWNLGQDDFTPAVVSVASGTNLILGGGDEINNFTIPTLDIGDGSTVEFSGTNLIAQTVNVGTTSSTVGGALLDLSQAAPLALPMHFPVPESTPTTWSVDHGFPAVPLVAAIGTLTVGEGDYTNLGSGTVAAGAVNDLNATGNGLIGSAANESLYGYDAAGRHQTIQSNGYAQFFPQTGPTGEAPCFCAGTPIRTAHGDVPAEMLRPGIKVRTYGGRVAVVRWVGRRVVRIDAASAPVCISAGAIAAGVPLRDVRLSPDHAVFLDGALIPARALVNGATIFRDTRCFAATYVHIELDRHDVVLAAGLPAESYLDTGNRGQFDAECGVRPLFHEAPADPLRAALDAYATRGCASLLLAGPSVEEAHRRLRRRAAALGWKLTADPGLSVTADMRGASWRDGAFVLPPGTGEVRIGSRFFIPDEIDRRAKDGRRLGVAIVPRLNGGALPKSAFRAGWHPPEEGSEWRWTDGSARLAVPPSARPAILHLTVVECGARYWLSPKTAVEAIAAASG